jgi:circadian clock protein KaiB
MARNPTFRFRLYVADHALNSVQAKDNLEALCHAHLEGRYEIEIVDVFKEPKRALADGILMTPTLLKVGPKPARRIVGTLAQTSVVLRALGLTDVPGALAA